MSNAKSSTDGRRRSGGASRAVRLKPIEVPDASDFYSQQCEGFRAGRGFWAVALCPFHDDRNPSFAINLESGGYYCRSSHCGARGNSIVSFVMAREGLSFREALKWLENYA